MIKQKQFNIRLNEDLYEEAMHKCDAYFGIGLSSLIKVFLRAFVSQSGVGFYVGDDDICHLFSRWLSKKSWDKADFAREWKKRRVGTPNPGPRLKDLFSL